MSAFDEDSGGEIDFREFIKLMTTKPYEKDTEDELVRVFETIDEDGKGYIDETDLARLAEEMKGNVTQD
jgi:Ca2+-binding EF-hand superfamily protein